MVSFSTVFQLYLFKVPVYGEKERKSADDEQVEYSESSLAARRSANVLKLKQLKEPQPMITPAYGGLNHHESSDNVSCSFSMIHETIRHIFR